jgi:RNA polymerase sigma factor (sigma-70 family)
MAKDPTDFAFRPAAVFRTTQWSMVLAAGSDDTLKAAAALEDLCGRYWYPLYAYVRRRGYGHADAADLTQSFFTQILEKHSLTGVVPGPARFRSFLLAGLKNFLTNEWRSANRLKRGGGKRIISLDDSTAEELYLQEPANIASPDKLYDKRWALSVIDQVLSRLRAEFVASERSDLFDALKPTLTADTLEKSYAEIADAFEMNEGAIKQAVHRLRKRFGHLLREEIAHTVQNPSEVEDELRHLVQALGEQ